MHSRLGRIAVIVAMLGGLIALAPLPAGAAPIHSDIIGGGTVNAATVPWTVAILDHATPNGWDAQFCGGSLVDPGWVLTAAHCVVGSAPSTIDVTWGVTNLRSITPANRRAVSQIIVNPRYRAANNTFDVALLKLAVPAPTATTIAFNANPTLPVLGQSLSTYGWGNTVATGPDQFPNELRGVGLSDRAGPSGACGSYGTAYIADHMVCAGTPGGGKDACQGDSGGPLVATIDGQPKLVGVTSWGAGCAQAAFPGVWSRVSSYADWINQQIHGAVPGAYIGNAWAVEGDAGNRNAFFTVTISPAPTAEVTIPYATVAGTATDGVDFTPQGLDSHVRGGTDQPDREHHRAERHLGRADRDLLGTARHPDRRSGRAHPRRRDRPHPRQRSADGPPRQRRERHRAGRRRRRPGDREDAGLALAARREPP